MSQRGHHAIAARLRQLAVIVFPAVVMGCISALRSPGGGPPPVIPIAFPLAADSVRFTSGFGDPRDNGRRQHHGQDIFCPKWTPVLAAVDGTVDWILTEHPKRGKGYRVLLRGDDGNLYYYDHLNDDNPGTHDNHGKPRYAYARGLKNGDRVAAGDILGYVGDSGNAEHAGPHLHFEIHIRKWDNPIDPAPSLREALERREKKNK